MNGAPDSAVAAAVGRPHILIGMHVMTNQSQELARVSLRDYHREYERIRGKPFERTSRMHRLYGEVRPEALELIQETSATALEDR